MSNRAVFDTFFADLDRLDLDAVMAAFSDDASYHDLPIRTDPTVGKAGIRKKLSYLTACERIEFQFSLIVEDGDRILAERVEIWHFASGARPALPVMCCMEFRDGKIARWREYWDMNTLMGQLPPEFRAATSTPS
ncbi:MAG TPA: nuclear transport factor 2 family protein [Acidimicrobiales bacterium]|jgi:limonene-1,2-epoxide hydrolase|nr:nuclear transport factor 2 family protein [Acidimicrobiales bacterium]